MLNTIPTTAEARMNTIGWSPLVFFTLLVSTHRITARIQPNRYVDSAFYGLRPASTGLIAAADISVAVSNLFFTDMLAQGLSLAVLNWKGWILAVILWVLTNKVKKTKGLQ